MQRILIVDDERININVLNELLKNDYKIMAAINGEQAIKAAQSKNKPDLVLLDIMMPKMDGFEVCKRLKSDPNTKDIPVIFVTANGQDSYEIKGFDVGAVDYITKPIVPTLVKARVKTQLTIQKNQKDLKEAYDIIEIQKKRMEEELNIAKDIQISMLPQTFPQKHEFDLYASMEAAREVGGDFYDSFLIDEDNLCVCIGDVSGKGVPASLFMAITKTLINSRATDDTSPSSILTHVNDEICKNNETYMFITVFLGILNIKTGELKYSNAGHNPPYILRSDKQLEMISDRHGPVIGAMDGFAYKESICFLTKNDLLFIFTDGVTEAMNKESILFGEENLEVILNNSEELNPNLIISNVKDAVNSFENGCEQTDDITMLSLLYKGFENKKEYNLKVTVKNELSEIDRFNSMFEEYCEKADIPQKICHQMLIIYDELLNNIISYGFKDNDMHEIVIKVDFLNKRLMTTIHDDGITFNPLLKDTPNTQATIEEREIGGLGIHFMKSLADKVYYRRGINKNILTFIKNI